MSELYPYLVAVAGVSTLMGVWLLVQIAWRRMFGAEGDCADLLALRSGCSGCSCGAQCEIGPRHPDELGREGDQPENELDDAMSASLPMSAERKVTTCV